MEVAKEDQDLVEDLDLVPDQDLAAVDQEVPLDLNTDRSEVRVADLAARPVPQEDLALDWPEIPITEDKDLEAKAKVLEVKAKVLEVNREVLEVNTEALEGNMEEEAERLAEKKVVMEESEHKIFVCGRAT